MKIEPKNTIIFLSGVLIMLLGVGFYLFKHNTSSPPVPEDVRVLLEISSSDELTVIEQELGDTDFTDLDKELLDIERELN